MEELYQSFEIKNITNVTGLTEELNILYIYNYFNKVNKNIIILTSSLFEATKYYEKLKTYTDKVYFFPMDEFLTSVAIAISPEFKNQRLDTIRNLTDSQSKIVVTNLMGFLRFLPSKKIIEKSVIKFEINQKINRQNLENLLNDFGYNKTSLVTSTGEYSVRGYVIDIFPIDFDAPIRIEFFGNVIEKIKEFDVETQISNNQLNKVELYPYKEIISSKKDSLYSYLNNPVVFNIEENIILNSYQQLLNEIEEYNSKIEKQNKHMFNLEEIKIKEKINIGNFGITKDNTFFLKSNEIENFRGNFDLLKDYVLNKQKRFTIVFMLPETSMIKTISTLFDDNVNIGKIIKNKINIVKKNINKGFIINNFIYISQYDIEDTSNVIQYKNSFKIGRRIKTFSDIEKGDYVVHENHGIGIYKGVVTLNKKDFKKDYIQINYLGNDKVYIPVEKINSIYKYADRDGNSPKIHKLDSTAWEKTKQSVRTKINDISKELIELYASRSKSITTKYKTFPEELKFASEFEYIETKDQSKSINEIDHDLKMKIPMDRLLCGDVGFGKTEVAFRGIFKTVMNGFQVAYLCPTTILSNQQYTSAKKRFDKYGINTVLLNRFTPLKEVNSILKGLKEGIIDIVFGTHKLLNDKIEYKNLGLLIIDEEQRFGVTHKEKIKTIKKNVNVLTLSATPIPRTLKMAMSGLKDLSIIDTPPQNRYPIQTYVVEENELLIKDAIYKELSRKGQVYLLYNNVKNIEKMSIKISKLVPDARIAVAHGQMSKIKLENIINDYIDYKYDVLICTTIIETGIDISNVNTLIVIDAQNFGLSQLYQLRGRVGRSNKIAYAYLMYNPTKTLTETAIKRLKAIKEFTELGSGYKIALRDLSIRGAGDLLGSEQAGFIASVGIDLYTKMVFETMQKLKGENVEKDVSEASLLDIDTHIPLDYVSDENIRIEIHRLINEIKDLKSLNKIKSELEDRFGKITEEINIYMHEEWLEKIIQKLKIKQINQNSHNIEIILPPELSDKLDGERLFLEVYNITPKFRLKYYLKRIIISLPKKDLEKHYIYYLVDLLNMIYLQIV